MIAKPKGRIAWSELLRDDADRDALTDAVTREIERTNGAQADGLRHLHQVLTGERGRATWSRLIRTDADRQLLFQALVHEIGPISLITERDQATQTKLDRLRGLLDRLTL